MAREKKYPDKSAVESSEIIDDELHLPEMLPGRYVYFSDKAYYVEDRCDTYASVAILPHTPPTFVKRDSDQINLTLVRASWKDRPDATT